MKKIEEIKEEFKNRIPSEAKENLILKEIRKYYKKKRFFLPVTLLIIFTITFFILKNFLPQISESLPIIVILTFIVSIIVASLIPVIHVLLKSDKGKLDELIKKEEFILIEKKIKETKKEISELKKERDNLDIDISELEAEKIILESMK